MPNSSESLREHFECNSAELRREINEGLNVIGAMERRQRLRLLRPPGRVGEQSKRGSRGQYAGAAPAAKLHALHLRPKTSDFLGLAFKHDNAERF